MVKKEVNLGASGMNKHEWTNEMAYSRGNKGNFRRFLRVFSDRAGFRSGLDPKLKKKPDQDRIHNTAGLSK
jgi:hypothetical protein